MSAAIARSDRRERLCAAMSTRSVLLSTVSAESDAASRPPKITSTTATTTKIVIMRSCLALSLYHREADEQVALQREHLFFFLGFGVIETEEMKQPVRRQ
jgi:hypothetical protein